MPPLQLASTGDDVRLWSLAVSGDGLTAPSSPTVLIKPHSRAVTGVHFNHNNSVLVTCGEDGFVSLQYANGTPLYTLPASAPASSTLAPLTCLALTSGSRYVACGGLSSRLTIWDLKRQAVNRHLEGHSEEITCLDLSPSAVSSSPSSPSSLLIASGSTSSSVLVHNVDSGVLHCSLSLPSLYPVRSVRFSPHDAAVLASGGDDGIPYLFDLASSSLSSSFSSAHYHPSSLTAVLFSPIHPSLLLSTSLSSQLSFHDVHSSSLVHKARASSAITSADWAEDGWHVLVGCRGGEVEVFDVRKEGHKLAAWQAHEGEVRSVKWQRMAHKAKEGAAGSSGAVKGEQQGSRLREDLSPSPNSEANSGDGLLSYTPGSNARSALYKHASDSSASATVTAGPSKAAEAGDAQHPPPQASATSSSLSSTAAPVVVRSNRALTFSQSTSQGGRADHRVSLSPPALLSPGRRAPLSPERSSLTSPLRVSSSRSPAAARRSSFPAPAPFASSIFPSSSLSSSPQRTSLPSSPSLPPHAMNGTHLPDIPPALSPTLHSFLDERFSALYTDVHRDLCNLQLDVFRQFHQQSVELSGVLASLMEQNAELKAELRDLKAEWHRR